MEQPTGKATVYVRLNPHEASAIRQAVRQRGLRFHSDLVQAALDDLLLGMTNGTAGLHIPAAAQPRRTLCKYKVSASTAQRLKAAARRNTYSQQNIILAALAPLWG